MAKKKAKAAGPKNFPKEQGEVGAADRFIPPDRPDQIPNDEDDRPQVVQVKDLSEGLEIVEDDSDDEEGPAEERQEAADDEDGITFEDAEESEEEETPRRNGRERHSRKVRARINRERSLTRQERLRAENAERRAKAMEDRVAKLERVTTDVSSSKEVKELEDKITGLRNELKEAIEKGDTPLQLDLTIKLGDAQGDLRLAKRDLEDAKRRQIAEEDERKKQREQEDAAAAEGGGDEPQPTVTEYMQANRTWWNKPRFARQQAMAVAFDKEILAEIDDGELDVEKYSDEHFRLLNERLAERYPDLPLHNADGEPYDPEAADAGEDTQMTNRKGGDRSRTNGERRPPVGGQGSTRSGRRQVTDADMARQGKVRLGDVDFTQMRMYGLDPKNAEHKKRFAKERMRSILTDERRQSRGTGARR